MMLKLIFFIVLFINTTLSMAQIVPLMEVSVDSNQHLFTLLERDDTVELISSDEENKTNTKLPSASVPFVFEDRKSYSEVDGMPILKPYIDTSAIPKFHVNPNMDYTLLKKE